LPTIFVVSRTTTFTYKGTGATAKEVAEDLGVRFVLEGFVRREGDNLEVTAQLIDAVEGVNLWGERYERAITDLFAVKDEITLNIVANIGAEVQSGERERIIARETTSLDAWLLYRQGRAALLNLSREELLKERQFLTRAIEIDPGFVTAYVSLATTHRLDGQLLNVDPPGPAFDRAMTILNQACALDPDHAGAHSALAFLYQAMGEIDMAVETSQKAFALNPNDFNNHAILGWNLNFAGRPAEALVALERATRLSPYYPDWVQAAIGDALLLNGDVPGALGAYQAELDRPPVSAFYEAWARRMMAIALDALGDEAGARIHVTRAAEVSDRTITDMRAARPFKNPATIDAWMDTLRRLGMAE
jgi:tetratricopeptide (TPR) repeat protein